MKLARDYVATGMTAGDQLRDDILSLVEELKPKNILETGTYYGLGTTMAIIDGMVKAGVDDFMFFTIEANPVFYHKAKANLESLIPKGWLNTRVFIQNGLSIPRRYLPATIPDVPEDIFTDYEDNAEYQKEIADAPDEALMKNAIQSFDYKPDFVLLDSAGHLGEIEFDFLMRLVDKQHSFVLVLDDTLHRKHYLSLQKVKADARFQILKESNDKFGYVIAKFRPSL